MQNSEQVKNKTRIYIAIAGCHEARGELRKGVESCIEGLNLFGMELSFVPSITYVEKMKDEIVELQRSKAPSMRSFSSLPSLMLTPFL